MPPPMPSHEYLYEIFAFSTRLPRDINGERLPSTATGWPFEKLNIAVTLIIHARDVCSWVCAPLRFLSNVPRASPLRLSSYWFNLFIARILAVRTPYGYDVECRCVLHMSGLFNMAHSTTHPSVKPGRICLHTRSYFRCELESNRKFHSQKCWRPWSWKFWEQYERQTAVARRYNLSHRWRGNEVKRIASGSI